jgi:ribosomal protein L16/L10AE
MNAPLRIISKRGRMWIEVYGVVCVRTYPQAMRLLRNI